MSDFDLANALYGRPSLSGGSGDGVAVTYGTAVSDSENGKVSVILDGEVVGDVVSGEDADNVLTVETSPSVREGDTVMVTLTGTTAKTPVVTAVVGSGDEVRETADDAQEAADDAQEAADAAQNSADGVADDLETAKGDLADSIAVKSRNFYDEPVPPYSRNDVWYSGDDGIIMICIASRGRYQTDDDGNIEYDDDGNPIPETFSADDWEEATSYTGDAAANAAQDAADKLHNALYGYVDESGAEQDAEFASRSWVLQTNSEFEVTIQETYATKDGVQDAVDTAKSVASHMRFDSEGLKIYNSENGANVVLTDKKLSFRDGDKELAYVGKDGDEDDENLYIETAQVLGTLRFGSYAFLPRDDGHMTLKYIG